MTTPYYTGWTGRPSIVEEVPADQKIWFVSDLHIGDATPSDAFFGKDRHLIALIERVQREGSLLVVVGDAIDFHQAWSFSRVLATHQDLFAAMSRLAKEGRLIYVIGNHDFEINLFEKILNFRVCDELHVGDQVLVMHGWQFDPYLSETVGRGHGWSTTIHHLFERYLNTWLRIPIGEFYTLGNRVLFWLAHKVALVANAYASTMKAVGLPRSAEKLNAYLSFWAQSNMGDSMGMFRPAMRALQEGPWPNILCGHSHLPGVVAAEGGHYVNTGSWTFASSHYVIWDAGRWSCRDWLTGRVIAHEFYEPLRDGVLYDKDFWQWWRENYMGLLRFREGEERNGRLRGWESYVRDVQYLSQLHRLRVDPLTQPDAHTEPSEGEEDPEALAGSSV